MPVVITNFSPVSSSFIALAKTTELDLTCFTTFRAKSIASICSDVGAILVTTLMSSSVTTYWSAFWTRIPPDTVFMSRSTGLRRSFPVSSKRKFLRFLKISNDPASNEGAIIISTNSLLSRIYSAICVVHSWLSAITQPKADIGSTWCARMRAVVIVSADATPQGLVCLMTAAVGRSKSFTSSRAPSASTMLLNESSLPWSCFAFVTFG